VKLHLQVGWGMMQHCCALIEKWGGGTAVLSPRDLECNQLEPFSKKLLKLKGGRVWLDPQFYLPHADHARLCSHPYWPFTTGTFWKGTEAKRLMKELDKLNQTLSTEVFILPGVLATKVNRDWLTSQDSFLETAKESIKTRPIFMTLALSDKAGQADDQIESLLDYARTWDVDGYYVVCQHPNGNYLVSESNWVANVLDLAAGLKLLGKQVYLAYSSHQMLIASLAKADGIISGTWLNVRSFPPDKFKIPEDDDPKQRSTWYYCPQALTEYKIPSMDLAKKAGLLGKMKAPAAIDGGFADALFTGIQPTAANFKEQDAFRHYLHCLRRQAANSSAKTFDDSVKHQRSLLTDAEDLIKTFRKAGVRGANRNFEAIISVNEDAISSFDSLRGPILRRKWKSL
jgi:hypothetical protein